MEGGSSMIALGDQTIWQEEKLEDLRYEYDLKPNDIVFDIGSYRQEFANKIRKRYGCYVECFDALDNKAAGTENGTVMMGGNFLYTSFFAVENQRAYKCVDIADYITQEISLVKMNIEGFEYVLLPYIIEKGLMSKIKNIQIQFHLIDGLPCEEEYNKIADSLKSTHSLTWRYPFVWENWKRND